MTAASACRKCGSQPREGARFCDACGSPMEFAAEPAEYKQVTVLFADVVRSMDIAATLGTERLREIMSELVNESAAVIHRYGGTLNQFTGDGIMALFGAPIALEDHAFRACLAALDIQDAARRLATEVHRRDGIALELRIGVNSGEVIAGEIGSQPMSYTAVGEQVGMAQRMESVAQPGGVMLSASTARLVREHVALGETEMVRIKGVDAAVPACRLLSNARESARFGRRESTLIGRTWETEALADILERSLEGSGVVVGLVGPPGIGKSRLARESATRAMSHGVEVFFTYCESHTREIPFHVAARLLRTVFGVNALSPEDARERIRTQIAHADPEDLILLDDLLGIRDATVTAPDISPDARRRRLTTLLNTAALERRTPAMYVIEDAHWIDPVSESMLVEFISVVPKARSLVVITYRPEYHGQLNRSATSEVITLAPLDDSYAQELTRELLGKDTSTADLAALVAERSAGNPFFAEEIVRDLAERNILQGERGTYVCVSDVVDVRVPATLHATIGARIDRLNPAAKKTLYAAAVIGTRFDASSLTALLREANVLPLIEAELVDHVAALPRTEYAFRHPLTQKVAYDSQLKSARSELHRRLAGIIEQNEPASADENAALIAVHWEAAGELRAAFAWHMRAGMWFNYRDIRAARMSWQRAQHVADQLRPDHPERLAMQIGPRTLLCGTTFRIGGGPQDTGFNQLRELSTAAQDNVSLAIGMAGHLTTLAFNSRFRDAVKMADELDELVESIGDETLTVALLYSAAHAKWEAGQATECLRLASRVIDFADGDPTKGNLMLASPLAWALAVRGAAKLSLGRAGWNHDIEQGIEMARFFDATARVVPCLYRYSGAICNGALLPDAPAALQTAELLKFAEQSGDDTAVALTQLNRGVVLGHQDSTDSAEVMDLLAHARSSLAQDRISGGLRRIADIEIARMIALANDLDSAIELAHAVVDEQFSTGDMISRGPAVTVLAESLLRRAGNGDHNAAHTAIERLAAVPTDAGFVLHEIPLLRLRAMLARAEGDEATYRSFADSYRSRASAIGFEGHIALANTMASE